MASPPKLVRLRDLDHLPEGLYRVRGKRNRLARVRPQIPAGCAATFLNDLAFILRKDGMMVMVVEQS